MTQLTHIYIAGSTKAHLHLKKIYSRQRGVQWLEKNQRVGCGKTGGNEVIQRGRGTKNPS